MTVYQYDKQPLTQKILQSLLDKFGNFKVYDGDYQRLKETNPTLPVLMQGLTELQRFYAKDN